MKLNTIVSVSLLHSCVGLGGTIEISCGKDAHPNNGSCPFLPLELQLHLLIVEQGHPPRNVEQDGREKY